MYFEELKRKANTTCQPKLKERRLKIGPKGIFQIAF